VRFSAGDGEFAVDVAHAVEVVTADRIVPLPDPAPGVVGLIHRREAAVPVLALFGTVPGVGRQHVLIVDRGGSWVGLLVDRVDEVTAIAGDRLRPAPAGQDIVVVEAVIVDGASMIMVIDPSTLLAHQSS
jgi:chemotaxis signal transduction protein